MSKIIKARFIIEDRINGSKQYNVPINSCHSSSLAIKEDCASEDLSVEAANEIYTETKKMIEDLMSDAQTQADLILISARTKAQALLDDSKKESEMLKNQQMDAGYHAGFNEGLAAAEKNAGKMAEEVRLLIEGIIKERERLSQKYERAIVDLVVLFTEKIIGTVLEEKPEIISQIVANVIHKAGDNEQFTIKVNPIHIPYLNDLTEKNQDKKNVNLQFVGDASLVPGDCVVIGENGFIEAKLVHELEALKRTLLDVNSYDGL